MQIRAAAVVTFPLAHCIMLVNAGAWYDAYIAILLVSALPNLLLILIPSNLLISNGKKGALNFQNMMLSFAAAGLLGDVFLHTLPHLIAPHSHAHGGHSEGAHAHGHEGHEGHHDEHGHDEHGHEEHGHEDHDHHSHQEHDYHNHLEHHDHEVNGQGHDHAHGAEMHHHEEHAHFHGTADTHSAEPFDLYAYIGMERTTIICVVLLLGFLVFMFAEKLASNHQGHSHVHDHDSDVDCQNEDETEEETENETTASASTAKKTASIRKSSRLKEKTSSAPASAAKATVATNASSIAVTANEAPKSLFQAMQTHLKASGWLNLFADSMHNFTDGIAIGASFASGHGLAYATFLSVIFHEIPHEIGDFTILIQSGLTKSQAIQAQFVTAIAAILGTSVGLLARRSEVAEELLLAFTAGGFLYLSTVNMLPGIVRTKSGLLQCTLEGLCFVLGVGMMVLVTYME